MVDVSVLTLWGPGADTTTRSLGRRSGFTVEQLLIQPPAAPAMLARGVSVRAPDRSGVTLRRVAVDTDEPLAALNLGLALAQGRYAVCLPAGSTFTPGFLAAAVAILDQDPSIGVVTPGLSSTEAPRLRGSPSFDVGVQLIRDQLPAASLVRRAALSGWDEALGGHAFWDGWLGVLGQGLSVRVLSQHGVREPRRRSLGVWSPVPAGRDADLPTIMGRHRLLYAEAAEDFWRAVEEQRATLMMLKRRYGRVEDLVHRVADHVRRPRA